MRKPTFTMEKLRNLALGMIVVLNTIATVVSFGESYNGLYRWAEQHQIIGLWGGVWPLMVDLIVLVAEAGLFVAHYDKWKLRHKAWLWFVLSTALGVSVGGNTGHILSHDWLTHLTAALPPVALMFTMTVGFGVMKRVFINKPKTEPELAPRPRAHVGTAPWVESPALATVMTPVTLTKNETKPVEEVTEKPAPAIPHPDFDLSETLVNAGFKVTENSFTSPPDPRQQLSLRARRVRDMYDMDSSVSANAVAKALGIAWQTAKDELDATKEARGLEV